MCARVCVSVGGRLWRGGGGVVGGRGGLPGPEGRHTMERGADQRSGEIELEIFHGWLA